MPDVPATVRAAVTRDWNQICLEEVPVPEPGPGEVLLRVRACAVDRFDLRIHAGQVPHARTPLVLGHEVAGEVAGLGAGVTGWQLGQRVTSTLYLTCGQCRKCQTGRETICENFKGYLGIQTDGGYAEFTVVPAANLVALPGTLGFPKGSVLPNAIGTPFHALTARLRLKPGERLIVTGAGGGVGLHAVQLARQMRAFVLAVDIGKPRRQAARDCGADLAVDFNQADFAAVAREWTNGQGVEAVLELTGAATLAHGLCALGKGGRLAIVGHHTGSEITAQARETITNEWEIIGSRKVTKTEMLEVVALVAAGRIRPVVTGVYPLEEAEAAHQALRKGEVVGRVVLVPGGEPQAGEHPPG